MSSPGVDFCIFDFCLSSFFQIDFPPGIYAPRAIASMSDQFDIDHVIFVGGRAVVPAGYRAKGARIS
jgi:hypothetical protein